MLDGCNTRYGFLEDILELERLNHADTIKIMTNELAICDNERKEWKRKSRRRVAIWAGVGVVAGVLIGLFVF